MPHPKIEEGARLNTQDLLEAAKCAEYKPPRRSMQLLDRKISLEGKGHGCAFSLHQEGGRFHDFNTFA